MTEHSRKKMVADFYDQLADKRDQWLKRNKYYHYDLERFFNHIVPQGSTILELGCGTGELLARLNPKTGVGIDISPEMVRRAGAKFNQYQFQVMDAERITLRDQFDYIILSDTVGYFEDVQRAFSQLNRLCHRATRIVITYQNFLWLPLLNLAEFLRVKMPSKRLNWLTQHDLTNLLNLEGFEVVKTGKRFLLPIPIPIVSWFVNRYLAHLPILNALCLTQYIIARPSVRPTHYRVSVIVPARNEQGNIERLVTSVPKMGARTELVFIEGHSTDATLDEIKRVAKKYSSIPIKYAVQHGKGKGDAVRKGFGIASGDILMILDADLTVSPHELPKFYHALASGTGEFINGSRLVYPMEKEAMRTLNVLGNRIFSILFTWLLGQPIKDTLCGTKALFKKDYERLSAGRSFFGDFDPFGDFDLLFGASKLNLKIVEIPIRYRARQYGTTNISRFTHGWLLLKMVVFALHKIKFT